MPSNKLPSIPISNPSRELEYINKYFTRLNREVKSGNYIGGSNVQNFEKRLCSFLGMKYAVSLNSGTDALACSLYSLKIGPGDEVILPSFTYFATAEVVINAGATPVFVDVEKESYCISLRKILPLVSNKTKCIIPVHLYGNDSDIENIQSFCLENKIHLIEDCAQAFGSKTKKGRFLGTFGNVNAFSSYPSKTLGGIGDGGFVVTNDQTVYKTIQKYKNHGQSIGYNHEISGINSRMDSLNAFTLNEKLKNFKKIKKSRDDLVEFYNKIFDKLEDVINLNYSKNTLYNYYTIQLPSSKRDKIQEDLMKLNIATSIYYAKPVHMQKALQNVTYLSDDLKNTNLLSKTVLSLPLFPFMKRNEKQHLKNAIAEVFYKYGIK